MNAAARRKASTGNQPRITISDVHTRLTLVEYQLSRLYWAVNGLLAISCTALIGAAVTWMLNGGLVHLPTAARPQSALTGSSVGDSQSNVRLLPGNGGFSAVSDSYYVDFQELQDNS